MKRKLGLAAAIMTCIGLLSATTVFAGEYYEDYSDDEYLEPILVQSQIPEDPDDADASDTSAEAGQSSSDLLTLQQNLSTLGYYAGLIDGDYGPATTEAVRRFQADYGLYVDGVAGNITMAALEGQCAPAASAVPVCTSSAPQETTAPAAQINELLKYGMTGPSVQQIQSELTTLGYDTTGTDGVFGCYTESAVRRFQQDNGLYVDGIAGPVTIALLRQKASPGQAAAETSEASNTSNTSEETQPYNPNPEADGSINKIMNEAASRAAAATGGNVVPVEGEVSGDVYMIQKQLETLGYETNTDGFYRPTTIAAIKEFQRVNGLSGAAEAMAEL